MAKRFATEFNAIDWKQIIVHVTYSPSSSKLDIHSGVHLCQLIVCVCMNLSVQVLLIYPYIKNNICIITEVGIKWLIL